MIKEIEAFLAKAPSVEETNFIINSIQLGPTVISINQIKNTIFLTRLANYNQRCLVNAMESPEYKVYPLYPDDTFKLLKIIDDFVNKLVRQI